MSIWTIFEEPEEAHWKLLFPHVVLLNNDDFLIAQSALLHHYEYSAYTTYQRYSAMTFLTTRDCKSCKSLQL